ncbi:MAG: L-histidine N(alpha)-methyltransferase [Micavibrio sp.]
MNVSAIKRNNGFIAAFKASARSGNTPEAAITNGLRKDFARALEARTLQADKVPSFGLLLKYSYYDSGKNSWPGIDTMDKAPWDSLSSASDSYAQFGTGEVRAINMAIRDGMLDDIPADVHYMSLGPGSVASFVAKDCKILSGLKATNHNLISATTVDINDRYARDAATEIYETFNCDAVAYQLDFFTSALPKIPLSAKVTPVIGSFGGTLQNMPHTAEKSQREATLEFYMKLRGNLPNAHLIMTVDAPAANIPPSIITAPYQYSLENELFILNFMARAKDQGIILDTDYNILRHWKTPDPVWKDGAVNLYAEAKTDHTLHTVDDTYGIRAGQRISVSTSQKAPIETHVGLLKEAGFTHVAYYPQNSQMPETEVGKYILHAAP